MAHFATLNEDNVVIAVEVVNNEVIAVTPTPKDPWTTEKEELGTYFLEQIHGGGGVTYKQTSYNGNFRKNFAQIGGTYDPIRDAFINKKPYDSWVLEESTCKWIAPKAYPTDGKPYGWDEESLAWREIKKEPD